MASLSYNFTPDPGGGESGLYSDTTKATFDDFKAYGVDARNRLVARAALWTLCACRPSPLPLSLEGRGVCARPALLVEGKEQQGGVAEVDRFPDDDYTVLVDVTGLPGTHTGRVPARRRGGHGLS